LFSPTYDAMTRRIRCAKEELAEPPLVHTTVVRHRLQLPGALLEQRVDQHDRDAAEPEATDRDRRAVGDVGHRLGCGRDHLVHANLLRSGPT
jgi:hypothetical protein